MRIVIAGGGTAGHVYPALATAHALRTSHGADVEFLGTRTGVESRLVPAAGYVFRAVSAKPLPRKLSPGAVAAPFDLVRAMRECRPLVAAADAVLGMGGYVSGPVVAAALRARLPVVLHEQNAVPGLANRLFARRAATVALSFESTAGRLASTSRTVVTGNPVREAIATITSHRDELRAEAMEFLGLSNTRRTVVIFGGSQGAQHINTAAVAACRLLRSRGDLQIVLLSGPAHAGIVASSLGDLNLGADELSVSARDFLDRMELAYAAADVVVSRAGATSIAETTCAGLPALLIPYPHATANHQQANARVLERAGAATIVEDGSLTASVLADALTALIDDEPGRLRMAAAALEWSKPHAAEALAGVVLAAAADRMQRSES